MAGNQLIHTTSLYLRQHAHNPINWYPWGAEALTKALQTDKPILVSIGYAACHWCHVMARESFEDVAVAAIMNGHFVCIKVDREERPDVDQVYIAAAQAMGLSVGWPLHIFLLPDQRPFYGGTYFPREAWKSVLESVAQAFQHHRTRLANSAAQFTKAIHELDTNLYKYSSYAQVFTQEETQQQFYRLYPILDHKQGGMQGAPKFPMPTVSSFLLHYYRLMQDEKALAQLNLTLEKMAHGGIYDQLGGGFARYATDEAWLVPHFEKMLYDNGQLISLYTDAYLTTPNALYKQVVEETLAFVERAMMGPAGECYSALDADSEGVEGKFYTWTQKEIEEALGEAAPLFITYFNITAQGNWEAGRNVLYTNPHNVVLSQEEDASIQRAKQQLFEVRATRRPPTLDDKVVTAWNGMMLQGLVDAYYALAEAHYLALALKNAAFIVHHLMQGGQLWHSYRNGQLGPAGYLADYAWVARALISLYQATFEAHWLYKAEALVQHAMAQFWDEQAGLFYFTAQHAERLIARPKEIFDNAIPSSNAVMAHNLFYLGILLAKEIYATTARQMLSQMASLLHQAPGQLSHWASLYILHLQPIKTVAILGPQCKAWARAIRQHYHSNSVLLAGAVEERNLPLLMDKKINKGKTTMYVCHGNVCQAPVHGVEEALHQLGYNPARP